MRLYNTLTRKVEPFSPIEPPTVKLYTCGPTVYNYYHIGNLRNAVFNDTLKRALAAGGLNVQHTMNITDVGHLVSDADEGEDKLEKGAKRENKSVWDVAAHYTQAFKADMTALNVLPPNAYHSPKYADTYARATEFIPQQIDMIKLLIDKDAAYVTSQAIYFDVMRLPTYGQLTGQKLADKEVAARSDVIADPEKRHPQDFSVWFFRTGRYADHSMYWPSPWGDGFPGWHLECSAIIHATLGDPIDIHTGGVDHIGTHHPNEMAQTEAAYGHQLSNVWLHNEFILVDDHKMAKSKDNSYLLSDVTAHDVHPLALRLLYLGAHYRSELNFTWDSLQAAQNTLVGLYAWADLVHQASPSMPKDLRAQLMQHLSDDLSTPAALAKLYELTASTVPAEVDLQQLDELFGLNLGGRPDISPSARELIKQRDAARVGKDWATADELRKVLADQYGLAVEDHATGRRWRRLSTTNA